MHHVRWTLALAALLAIAALLPLQAGAGTITVHQNDDLAAIGNDLQLGGGEQPTGEGLPGPCGDDCLPSPDGPDSGSKGDDVFETPIDDDVPGPIEGDVAPAVPEPATLTMLGIGLGGLFVMGRRRS